MKTIITGTKIHCDECHHEFDGLPPDHHNKPCPQCGLGVLINDADLEIWNALVAMANAVQGIGEDNTPAAPLIEVKARINTAALRGQSPGKAGA